MTASPGAPGRASPAGPLRPWILGARPRTLSAAAVPVVVGTAAGWSMLHDGAPGAAHGLIWWRAVCALVVALAIQIGTNYANDYSDGIRGTDAARVGPARLVASGAASPGAVRTAALASFAVAGVAGLGLAAATTWWLVPVGLACVLAGWTYTGGPRPYGYLGLGEVFVFAFFGLVATVGSAYVQVGHLGWLPVAAAVPVGFLSVALLEANNLRDVEGDAGANKRTLAVRVGSARAGLLYLGALAGALAGVALTASLQPGALLALLAAPLAVVPVRTVRAGARGPGLLPVLGWTGRLQLVGGLLLAVGLLL